MKRAAFVLGLLAVLVILTSLLCSQSSSLRPRFVSWPAGQPCPVFALTNFLPCNQRFDEPRVWLQGRNQCLLYDVEAQKPLGYLTNGFPLAMWSNQLVCAQYSPCTNRWLNAWWKARDYLKVLPRPPASANRFWLLDLADSKARYLGSIIELNRHRFELAPGNRLGLYFPAYQNNAGWLFDFAKQQAQFINLTNDFAGWWDDHQVLLITPGKDLVLQTLPGQQTSPLVAANEIARCVRTNYLPEIVDPVVLGAWNGPTAQYYIYDYQEPPALKTLLKLNHPDGRLVPHNNGVMDRNGQYWGRVDPSGQFYAGNLPSANGHIASGLLAYDLTTGKTNLLAASDDTKSHCRIILRQNAAYYIDSENTLRKAALDGSGQIQIYPPLAAESSRR